MNITQNERFLTDCTGCTACVNACPANALEMKMNEEGFLYPNLLSEKCIDCGKCVNVCVALSQKTEKLICNMHKIYAYQTKDEDTSINATSGGLFPELSKYVIENFGVVFGASYDENMSVLHTSVSSIQEIYKFNGSKYVQSDLNITFSEAKKLLDEGILVLYSGTPCQIQGLKSYLNKDYSNLITVDLICYGVPSDMFFKKYISFVEKKERARVIDFKFRDKHKYGWSHTVVITFQKENGDKYSKIYGNEYNNLWYRAWKKSDCLRESCYSCPLVSKNRIADFTIGNFWGIQNISENFNYRKGVSFLSVNNAKKEYLIEHLKTTGILEEQGWEMVDKLQHGLKNNKKRTQNRNVFYTEISKGYDNLINILYPLKLKDKFFANMPIRLQGAFLRAYKKFSRGRNK